MADGEYPAREEGEILTAYALRIDGYKVIEGTGEARIAERVHGLVNGLEIPADPVSQFACLFMLQRLLFKWGGESLPPSSFEWRAIRTAFLLTAMLDPPEHLRDRERYATWEEDFLSDRSVDIQLVARAHATTRYMAAESGANGEPNGLSYYFLEDYLLNEVRHWFQGSGYLGPFNFFSIVIWKANRAKTTVARGLRKRFPGQSLADIVDHLAKALQSARSDRDRLHVLMHTFGLRLPMASAILTILYPEEFTVFDVRACEALDVPTSLVRAAGSSRFDTVWNAYVDFRQRVECAYPDVRALRDKDRALWAQSAARQLMADLDGKLSR